MSITTVTTAASRRALTTVERYRETMPETAELNARLETLIGQASAAIETYLNRKLARERVTEAVYEEAGVKVLLLERRPVVAVHGVKVDGEDLESTAWSLESTGGGMLRLDGAGPNALWDEIVGQYGGGSNYGYQGGAPARLKIEVDYTAGYIVPGQVFGAESEPDLPLELELACQIAVQGWLEAMDRPAGVTSEKLGDASWSYAAGAATRSFINGDVMALLAPHRLVTI